MDANRAEVHGWWVRLLAVRSGSWARSIVTGRGLDRLAGSGRFGSILRVLAGPEPARPDLRLPEPRLRAEPVEPGAVPVAGRRPRLPDLLLRGSATRLAIPPLPRRTRRSSCTARRSSWRSWPSSCSRSVTFQPGLVYGFIASAVIVAPIALAKRDDATLVLVPAFGLLVVSVLAWLLLGPVRRRWRPTARRAGARRIDPGDDRHRRARGPVHHDDPAALPRRLDGHGLEPGRLGADLRGGHVPVVAAPAQPGRGVRRRVRADQRPGRPCHAGRVHADDRRAVVVLPLPADPAEAEGDPAEA